MKYNGEVAPRYQQLLKCFTHLPQQILSLHGHDGITEFVLHSLCDKSCLNLSKAAYFVDNPDFDCLKGVAGFNNDDDAYTCSVALRDKETFKEHANLCAFNKKVRDISACSGRRSGCNPERTVESLACELGFGQPFFYTWPMKHDNFGLLIFERAVDNQGESEEFEHGISLLGFCPVH